MEETKVQDDSKQEAAGLSAQDQARKRKKAANNPCGNASAPAKT